MMPTPSLIDLAIENPRGWGREPPQVAFVDDAGNRYAQDGQRIQNAAPGAGAPSNPSVGQSLLNIATSPARLAVSMVTEPVNALARLAENSRFPDGRMGIPNPRNPQNQQDVLTGLLSMYGGNALSPAKMLRNTGVSGLENSTFASRNANIW